MHRNFSSSQSTNAVKTTLTLFRFRLRWKNQLQSIKPAKQCEAGKRNSSKEEKRGFTNNPDFTGSKYRWKPVKRAETPLSRRNSDTDSNSQNTRKPLRSLTSQELSQPK